MTTLNPTVEQAAAVDAFATGTDLVLQAGAGTGKTSTLEMLAASDTGRRGVYVAFNRAVKDQAARRFPPSVKCSTGHGLAYGAVGRRYKHRFGGARTPAWKTAELLGLRSSLTIGQCTFTTNNLAYIVKETVLRYCQSADRELSERHVPKQRGAEDPQIHRVLASAVLPYAQRAWRDLQRPDGDKLRVEHDHYLKVWQLTDPYIRGDYILLDEAQDTNPALEYVLKLQRDHAQLVLVGDSAQQIYSWRGARDIMTGFDGTHLTLSQSFRFGPALAAEANQWLTLTRSPLRLTGHRATQTRVAPTDSPEAILCRTNGGAMAEVLHQMDNGKYVAMAGGGDTLRKLAVAARDLKSGKGTRHPELFLFKSWGELQDYAENDPAGADLLPWVDLVDDLGTEAVLEAVDRLGAENACDVTVSTVHKAKGREWPSVRIGEDFAEPEPDALGRPGPIAVGEARLAYVAITRARHHLDIGGLGWFKSHPQAMEAQTKLIAASD
ncbi:UvrD-helicase domain-containing protein [Streptomyces sp. SCA3-4]|uniref:UvrD-helicase domain-containing protein n=1 Tax=Streptomyces sichuanensis TaxID=2871810 RepID=UPI001CE30735|nr:UvrD-helicase domain-containing protein [Streptomyces sichuanensis]MCA6095930.1 UvrD-helicase domain-containing protein [Streptomyces sichuanensis]